MPQANSQRDGRQLSASQPAGLGDPPHGFALQHLDMRALVSRVIGAAQMAAATSNFARLQQAVGRRDGAGKH